jgi:hypothetical protein
VLIARCPRCRAEDISADAHPARVLDNGVSTPVFVCRNCYRAAELEYRIACSAAAIAYGPLQIREGLRLLRDFYRARIAALGDTDALHEAARDAALPPVQAALEDVERRLAIAPLEGP